ncbi:BCS1 N terminal-domain-containing protein [Aspergillus floccosus]
MTFSALASGGLAPHAPLGPETIQQVTGFDFINLVNLAFLFAGSWTFLYYSSTSTFKYFVDYFATTVRVDDDDPLYHHLLQWTMDHHPPNPRFCSLRAVSKIKGSWAHEEKTPWRGNDDGLYAMTSFPSPPAASHFVNYRSIVDQPPIHLEPFQGMHLFRYQGKYIFFRHRIMPENQSRSLMKERGYIRLQCFGASPDVLQALLQKAQSYNLEKNRSTRMTAVYRPFCGSEYMHGWSRVSTRPSRHISTVIFDRKKKDDLLRDINEYLHPRTRQWYSDHGIPYRRGYLFSGVPGLGKTSLASALAGVFGLNIYVLSLLDPHLTDAQLMQLMSEIPSHCIVLLEDVDAAGLGRRDLRDSFPTAKADMGSISETTVLGSRDSLYNAKAPVASISLSGLLNAIDGVSSQEGRILIMTTNSPESLDPALIRPGRVDMHVDFQLPSRDQMRALFVSMYSDVATEESEPDQAGTSLDAMAEQFSSSIPERSISLARLQGYLLQYKHCPEDACENVEEWVKENNVSSS